MPHAPLRGRWYVEPGLVAQPVEAQKGEIPTEVKKAYNKVTDK
jgi:hypothetical protein